MILLANAVGEVIAIPRFIEREPGRELYAAGWRVYRTITA